MKTAIDVSRYKGRPRRLVGSSVRSTAIATLAYNSAQEILQVEFRDGVVVQYLGVSQKRYAALERARSVGNTFNRQIKWTHPYIKIADPREGRVSPEPYSAARFHEEQAAYEVELTDGGSVSVIFVMEGKDSEVEGEAESIAKEIEELLRKRKVRLSPFSVDVKPRREEEVLLTAAEAPPIVAPS